MENATIEGFITHDADTRVTKTKRVVTTFQLAINHYSKPDEPPRVSFIAVEIWDYETPELLVKGKRVMVSGDLRQDRWEDDKGKICSRLKVIANEITFRG